MIQVVNNKIVFPNGIKINTGEHSELFASKLNEMLQVADENNIEYEFLYDKSISGSSGYSPATTRIIFKDITQFYLQGVRTVPFFDLLGSCLVSDFTWEEYYQSSQRGEYEKLFNLCIENLKKIIEKQTKEKVG